MPDRPAEVPPGPGDPADGSADDPTGALPDTVLLPADETTAGPGRTTEPDPDGGCAGDPPGPLGSFPVWAEADDAEFDRSLGEELFVYEFESMLGRGGMGRVYLARHRDLLRRCALKVLSPRRASGDVDFVGRFRNEGRAAASLSHPNLVVTHAIGEERGFHWLEMEFVPGRTLGRLLAEEGPLPTAWATTLAARVADGLGCAHRAGVVHRDLKPDNVLVTMAGVPKVADFGLAKRVRDADGAPIRAGGHALAGTPGFMAPETFAGAAPTPAADVWALGVTYFLMLTGRMPFAGRTFDELSCQVRNAPVPNVRELNPEVPLEIGECLALLLEKTPENRPPDALAALHLLEAVSGETRDVGTLLAQAFRGHPEIRWMRCGETYRLNVPLPHGRSQAVLIEPSADAVAERLLHVTSVCCPAEPAFYEAALKLNAQTAHGALSIRTLDPADGHRDAGGDGGETGDPFFVMSNAYPRATVDPEEIRHSVFEVAAQADAVEKLLTGRDVH